MGAFSPLGAFQILRYSILRPKYFLKRLRRAKTQRKREPFGHPSAFASEKNIGAAQHSNSLTPISQPSLTQTCGNNLKPSGKAFPAI